MCTRVRDGETHERSACTVRPATGQDGEPIALPQTRCAVEGIQANSSDRVRASHCQDPDDVIALVGFVDIRADEDLLLVNENGTADFVVHGHLFGADRLETHDVEGASGSQADSISCVRRHRRGHEAEPFAPDSNACTVLIAEHAWQRAQPADTMSADMPCDAMYVATSS